MNIWPEVAISHSLKRKLMSIGVPGNILKTHDHDASNVIYSINIGDKS